MCYIIISFGAISAAVRSPRARFVLLSSFFLMRAVCIKYRSATEGFKKAPVKKFYSRLPSKHGKARRECVKLLCLRERERKLGVCE